MLSGFDDLGREFVSDPDFGGVVTYRGDRGDADPVDILGILDLATMEQDPNGIGGNALALRVETFSCLKVDIPNPLEDDIIEFEGDAWTVSNAVDNGGGMWLMNIQRKRS